MVNVLLATTQTNSSVASHQGAAIGIGLAAIVLLGILYVIVSKPGSKSPLKIVIGADGLPSTSKTQFLLWTVVVLFSYVAIVTERMWGGDYSAIANIPANVLIALGFSGTTAVAAKAITVSYLNSGQITKASPADSGGAAGGAARTTAPRPGGTTAAGSHGFAAILQDDAGYVDLTKVQILAWTLVALSIFLARVFNQLSVGDVSGLPDIDASLMVLTGLSAGAYLGKKLVTTSTPTITSLAPATAKPGQPVTLTGTNFGSQQGNSLIWFDGVPLLAPVDAWQDTQVTFKVPPTYLDQTPWKTPSQTVAVSLAVNGQSTANTATLVVVPE